MVNLRIKPILGGSCWGRRFIFGQRGINHLAFHANPYSFGYQPEELMGKSVYQLLHPDELAEIKRSYPTIQEKLVTLTFSHSCQRKNGDYSVSPAYEVHFIFGFPYGACPRGGRHRE